MAAALGFMAGMMRPWLFTARYYLGIRQHTILKSYSLPEGHIPAICPIRQKIRMVSEFNYNLA